MSNLKGSTLVFVTIALGACAAARDSDQAPSEATSQPTEETDTEAVAEAQDPSVGGWLCGGLCASAGGVACALVADTCATATVVTVGSTAIPCAVALVGSCLGTLACLSLCAYDTPGIK